MKDFLTDIHQVLYLFPFLIVTHYNLETVITTYNLYFHPQGYY